MSARPLMLELFSCAGGSGMGYHHAGFEVVGVDIRPQPRYPFEFHQADALEVLRSGVVGGRRLSDFSAVHASPPCQFGTRARNVGTKKTNTPLNLIPETREGLRALGVPYVIENVEQVREHLVDPLMLCGSMFGLAIEKSGERFELRRHRLFESNVLLMAPGPCRHRGKVLGVYHTMGDHVQGRDLKNGGYVFGGRTVETVEEGRALMGIDWMLWPELREAIPPAYTEWLGAQVLAALAVTA